MFSDLLLTHQQILFRSKRPAYPSSVVEGDHNTQKWIFYSRVEFDQTELERYRVEGSFAESFVATDMVSDAADQLASMVVENSVGVSDQWRP